ISQHKWSQFPKNELKRTEKKKKQKETYNKDRKRQRK
uniref:Predicted gene 11099 n=1 Tax=Mus spicilegus TaxID=10103 RepID=A0A8C6G7Z8_MUSSI